jgi:hypothetical protein
VKAAFWPAFNVNELAIPLISSPTPLAEICEISTAAAPTFVSMTVADCFPPTVTLPKSALAGVRFSCPTVDVPVPDSKRLITGSDAVLVIERVALKVPAVFGTKATLIWALCPAVMVIGRLGELREKYFVEIAMLLMVSDADPEFVAVVEMVLLEPVLTLPKFKEADVNESALLWVSIEGGPLLTPWQLH